MRDVKNLIVEELSQDRELRAMHLNEAIGYLMKGKEDYRVGLLMIRNIVNATCGFPAVAKHLEKSPKSVMRMLTPGKGSKSDNLLQIIHFLLQQQGYSLEVRQKIYAAI